jgi:hypothetical protein
MGKIYAKLIAITFTLVLSVSVVVMSSYAWLVLSGNPVATGIQVTIGGGNTILIAPNVPKEVDGVVYHMPGPFSDTMNFNSFTYYDYLDTLGGLSPVSTADGVHWFLPEYYDFSDPEVQQGRALSGQLKDFSEFYLDGELEYANLPADDKAAIEKGSYVYLDFWVVSPGENFTLRVSAPTNPAEPGGSFLIDLLQPQLRETKENELQTDYVLGYPEHQAAAAIRLGFLANPTQLTDDTMLHYQNSVFFDQRFTKLRGLYSEPNTGTAVLDTDRFTIYEPNADSHPNGGAAEGTYVETNPIGYIQGQALPVSVADRLTVQKRSSWTMAENGLDTALEQRFQACIYGKDLENAALAEIAEGFYASYLQWQISPYVRKGTFIKNTSNLYGYGGYLTAEEFNGLDYAGATDDVYIIELERNVPQRIRLFIWLEGQDVDCVNAVNTARFAINIELAGSNQEMD